MSSGSHRADPSSRLTRSAPWATVFPEAVTLEREALQALA